MSEDILGNAPLNIYVFHRSYFCGKMLAYLRYKEIPHHAHYQDLGTVGGKIARNTGLRQMPVIELADGRWISDTTPMIEWLETRHPECSLFTGDPVTDFFIRLLEDYADEWMWRPAILSRWQHKGDRYMYMTLFVREFLGGIWKSNPLMTKIAGHLVHRHQDKKFLRGDGITKDNVGHVWAIYENTLARLEAIFQKQPYLLGDKPCFADFAFFGSMFWHFGNDPTPNRIMQEQAPGVYEWVARMWNMTRSKAEGKRFNIDAGTAPPRWGELLKDVCEAYLPYLHLNAKQFRDGNKRFDFPVQGQVYPGVHVSPYRVWCRERLQQHLAALSAEQQEQVRAVLEPLGGWQPLVSDGDIASDWDPDGIAPFCKPAPISLGWRLKAPFVGSNHVRSVRAWRE